MTVSSAPPPIRLAVVGMGLRAKMVVKLFAERYPTLRLGTVVDPQGEKLRSSLQQEEIPGAEICNYYKNVNHLLENADGIDALVIGSPCHLHSKLAMALAPLRLPLFLEKPVATTWEDLNALRMAYRGREDSVVVSFPLRLAPQVQQAAQIVRSGRLGKINQIQAVNNVPYGGVYFGGWYRDYRKTGGLWLQKATHDFDYITHMMGSHPHSVTAMHSRQIYGGNMPEHLRCSACGVAGQCKESPQQIQLRGDDGGMGEGDHECAFSESIMNQDAGSAIVMYDNGAHACYSQNFVSRRSAASRGATITGYDATLRFDWYAKSFRIIDHHANKVEDLHIEGTGSHMGGDGRLAENFIDVITGKATSLTPLDDGILSAAMCLAARESANTGIRQQIPRFGRSCISQAPPVETVIEPLNG